MHIERPRRRQQSPAGASYLELTTTIRAAFKANLAGTVAFRVRSRVNSEILLDDDRAARLPHRPGRALWVHERVEEFQAVDLDLDEARQRLAARGLLSTTGGCGALHVTPPPNSAGEFG